MKSKKILLALAAIGLIVAGYGLYTIGMKQGLKMAAPGTSSSPSSSVPSVAEKKVLYWHDPMVPGQKFDKPGKSPFMDMQLVPVYADAASDEGKVNISARVQQNLGIRTAEVVRGNLTAAIAAVGSVAYNERSVALVQARSNGYVERLYVRAALDPVRKGQPLAELYVPDWVAAQEEYLSVKRMGSAMSSVADGARQRMRLVGMSDEQIRQVEASGKVQARLTITAPVSGVVTELAVREGMTVMNGAPMFRINGLDSIWVYAELPENISAQVRPGSDVEARSLSLPGMVFKGKIGALLPDVNATTRTLKARIEIANSGNQLVPGMFVNVNITPTTRKEALLVPSEAVIQTGLRNVVMVATGDGKFMSVDVETGTEANGQTEIVKGLEAGQNVVVSGQFLIDSEASLKGTATRMSDASAPAGEKSDASNQAAGANATTHRAEGKIEEIAKDDITISHGPIASLKWGPMTMGFKPPAAGLPKNLKVGDVIVFEFRTPKEGVFEITSIAPKAATVDTKEHDAKAHDANVHKAGAKK